MGSPPHTRGKDKPLPHLSVVHGITPAYAGKSPSSSSISILSMGSPPHTRGKVGDVLGVRHQGGITPAYAGKRTSSSRYSSPSRDHPRIRGEKPDGTEWWSGITGSPPHTRGKDVPARFPAVTIGITPAYAGKRTTEAACHCAPWDHPRIRGEKFDAAGVCVGGVGSPPHTRGKESIYRTARKPVGITPAYAGKSGESARYKTRSRDHPRIRGEKVDIPAGTTSIQGSPPHTRGKVWARALVKPTSGITPAYAGKSPSNQDRSPSNRDHPRIRGEKPIWTSRPGSTPGSPPHTRGKAPCLHRLPSNLGITPAYAGKRLRNP